MGFARALRTVGCGVLAGALTFASAPLAAADQVREDQWALKALNAESAWKISEGSGVTVAVIDDGVNAGHADLKGNVLKGKDFMDGGSVAPGKGDNHGTAMASIIAGHGHGPGATAGVMGLAPKSKILPIREFGTDGPGTGVAIRYAVDNGASVINVSQCFESSSAGELDRVSDAVAYALKRDVLVVSGSGNDGDGRKCYPAASPGGLGVGAVTNNGSIWQESNYGAHVALAAPGTNIVSAAGVGNEYSGGNGTSNATAYVSAAAALLRSKFPDLTAGQIANRLVKTAQLPASAKGLSLPDERYGYGIIQPLAALTEDIPAGSKYGPLKVPDSLKKNSPTAAPDASSTSEAAQKKSDMEAVVAWTVIGIVGLAVLGLIVLVIVKLSRRKQNNNSGPRGPGSDGYPLYDRQPLPPQQNPYQQQPAQSQGPWPPQQ